MLKYKFNGKAIVAADFLAEGLGKFGDRKLDFAEQAVDIMPH